MSKKQKSRKQLFEDASARLRFCCIAMIEDLEEFRSTLGETSILGSHFEELEQILTEMDEIETDGDEI